jgi:hypothetical protein
MGDKERNAGKTLKDAAAAWNAVRQSEGPRDYASSVARAKPAKPRLPARPTRGRR